MNQSTVNRRSSYTHERGDIRRQELLDAAIRLFSRQEIDQVSFVEIARDAEVPTASAYHFYKNKNDLLAALVAYYHEEVNEFVLRPFPYELVNTWMDVIDQIIERAREYFENRDVARKLFYSGKTPPEIKLLDRKGDKEIGSNIEQILNKHFVMPDIPNNQRVFYILVELIDTIFTLSVTENGTITEAYLEETRRATKSYLKTYLPEILTKK
ncbi:MAG: TetR family transcriptional regulator [Gammaproteobacteria bacterium]|nr:TetR family transcriptional regulator [Gammaproteobacteria bacterium]